MLRNKMKDPLALPRNEGPDPDRSLVPVDFASDYSTTLADLSAHILYRSPLPSQSNLPIFVLNAAAFPDAKEVDYDVLLPYVLSRLPGEEELIGGKGYEVLFLSGGGDDGTTTTKKGRPGWGWFVQAYHVLTRAMRKRLQKLYIVHERAWVRVLVEMFSTIVSPKFRKKIIHVSTFTALALHLPIEDLLIPPSAYLHDRRLSPDIHAPYVTGRRAFSARQPLPMSPEGERRLPRVLRETSSFVLLKDNVKNEGIFRIPPHNRLISVLKEAYNRGQKFILWKEDNVVLSIKRVGNTEGYGVIEEIDHKEGYGLHLATGLIKLWYRDLRDPVLSQSSYKETERLFGDSNTPISIEQLREFFSPDSEWSPLLINSRLIMTNHLLPLLAEVAAYREYNKMTPFNLAVCFTPALIRGPDPVEDVRIGAIARRVIEAGIEQWNQGLMEACGVGVNQFRQSLQPPNRARDYEDPLEEKPRLLPRTPTVEVNTEGQSQGIILEDREISSLIVEKPPPLPPRRPQPSEREGLTQALRRKPVPPLAAPPRYSVAMGEQASSLESSPVDYINVADSFRSANRSGTEDTGADEKGAQGDRKLVEEGHEGSQSSNKLIDIYDISLTVGQIDDKSTTNATPPPADSKTKIFKNTGDLHNSGGPRVGSEEGRMVLLQQPSQTLSVSTSLPGLTTCSTSLSSHLETPNNVQDLTSDLGGALHLSPSPHVLHRKEEPSFTKPTWTGSSRSVSNPTPSSTYLASTTVATIPKSTSKTPTILNLAKPIHPLAGLSRKVSLNHLPNGIGGNTHGSCSTSSTFSNATIRRRPSMGLSQRIETLKPSQTEKSDLRSQPKKLMVGEGTVGDLRKLYEERAGAARKLVEAGKVKVGVE
ncbi:hypothetical protein FGG08_002084 [Glutinoglossum americanum]|uniref:Uncharacterized protein n=1 Tax=Glutinoglossum americanum TaxID=1670608 RepID=A0A9P8KZJ7_9PEZI|nr:hypothetical protein FGG08_002084 [Glutinoglossum americanum]